MNKELMLLGLAKKAGRLAIGDDAATEALRTHTSHAVILASDASDNTRTRFERLCAEHRVALVRLPYTKMEVGGALGRALCAAAAVCDAGFAASFTRLRASAEPENEVLSDVAQSLDGRARAIRTAQREKNRDKTAGKHKPSSPATAPAEKKPVAARRQNAQRADNRTERPQRFKVYGRHPAMGKSQSEETDRKQPFGGERKPYAGGDRKPFDGERKPYAGGDKKPYSGERKPYAGGDKKPYSGERKPYAGGDKKPYSGERKPYAGGDKKPYSGERKPYAGGDKKPYSGERKPYAGGDKKPYSGERKPYAGGDKKPYSGERKPYAGGDKKPYSGERKPYAGGDRKPFDGERKPYAGGDKKPYSGERKPYAGGDKKPYSGERKPFSAEHKENRGYRGGQTRPHGAGGSGGAAGRPRPVTRNAQPAGRVSPAGGPRGRKNNGGGAVY